MEVEFTATAVRIGPTRLNWQSGPQARLPHFTVRAVKGGKGIVGGFTRARASTRRQCGFIGGTVKDHLRGVDVVARFVRKNVNGDKPQRALARGFGGFASSFGVSGAEGECGQGMVDGIGSRRLDGLATQKKGGQVRTESGHET